MSLTKLILGVPKGVLKVSYWGPNTAIRAYLMQIRKPRNQAKSRGDKLLPRPAKAGGRIRNEQVTGSSPAASSIGKSRPPGFLEVFSFCLKTPKCTLFVPYCVKTDAKLLALWQWCAPRRRIKAVCGRIAVLEYLTLKLTSMKLIS